MSGNLRDITVEAGALSSLGVKGDVYIAGNSVFGAVDTESYLEIHSIVEGRFPLSLAEASNPAAHVTLRFQLPSFLRPSLRLSLSLSLSRARARAPYLSLLHFLSPLFSRSLFPCFSARAHSFSVCAGACSAAWAHTLALRVRVDTVAHA